MPISHPSRIALTATAALALATLVAPLPASAQARTVTAFGGSAFGSAGHLGATFKSGKSALVPLCTVKAGVTHTDRTQNSSNSKIGSIGSVHTSTSSHHTGGTLASVSKARTEGTSLFNRAITGDAFAVTARAARSASGGALVGTTTLIDVHVFGKAAPTHPARNQKMTIPGVGAVVLNKQVRSHKFGMDSITVIAMKITLSANNTLHLPSGSVTISSANASLHKPTHQLASGNAFGTTIVTGPTLHSGKTAPVYLPCGGTSGATLSNFTGAVTTPGLRTSATHSRARSFASAGGTTATLSSTISRVNLLGGVVKATAIVGRATATRSNGMLHRSSTGTSFGGFTINGHSQSSSQPANTKMTIPGVGTLWVHRVVKTATGLHVYALQLILSRDQAGLTKGSVLTIGGASAAVAPQK